MITTTSIQASPEQLSELINKGIKAQIDALKKDLLSKNANEELMTREEACEFLKIDPSTLWAWQNKGRVTAYGIAGHRRYYKRSELWEALQPLKK